MILTFLILILTSTLTFIFSFLPVSSLPTGVSDSLNYISSALNQVTYLIPVDSLFTAIGIVVIYEASIWAFFGLMWIWKRIPFIGR